MKEEFKSASDGEFDGQYRTLSKSAVFSICFGIISLSGFLFAAGVAFAFLGLCCAAYSYLAIRRYPDELTGRGVAVFGCVLCLILSVSISGMHTYIYLTEVPDGHVRITFGEIKAPKYRKYEPTAKAMELNGEKVFIKGYTFPGKQRKNLSQFLLVGDFGQCCFGGNPEPSHLIRVSIKNGRKIDYSQRLRKLSGTFRVLERAGMDSEGKGYLYEIDADDIK